jgi:hypothetical protein
MKTNIPQNGALLKGKTPLKMIHLIRHMEIRNKIWTMLTELKYGRRNRSKQNITRWYNTT